MKRNVVIRALYLTFGLGAEIGNSYLVTVSYIWVELLSWTVIGSEVCILSFQSQELRIDDYSEASLA
jgi:hypothetical protein